MTIKVDFFPWREPTCDCTVAHCPSSFLPFSGLSFIFYHLWFRLSPSWQGPAFYIRLCLKQRHLLLVFESIKNVADQCHYPALHLEDKSSVAVELMLSGARKQRYILGYHGLARGRCGCFHLKFIARVEATKAPMTVMKLITQRPVLVALSDEVEVNKNFDCSD